MREFGPMAAAALGRGPDQVLITVLLVSRCAMLSCAVPRHTMLGCAALCCAVLCTKMRARRWESTPARAHAWSSQILIGWTSCVMQAAVAHIALHYKLDVHGASRTYGTGFLTSLLASPTTGQASHLTSIITGAFCKRRSAAGDLCFTSCLLQEILRSEALKTNELLRHFWGACPIVSAPRQQKAAKLCHALEDQRIQ